MNDTQQDIRTTRKKKPGNFIYVGPSIPQVGLKENTLYRSEDPPESLMRFVREKPVLRALYVSTKDLAKTQQAMRRKGTVEHTASELLRTLAKSMPR